MDSSRPVRRRICGLWRGCAGGGVPPFFIVKVGELVRDRGGVVGKILLGNRMIGWFVLFTLIGIGVILFGPGP